MAPQPRVAPPPPPPPVLMPTAPGTPGPPASVAPRNSPAASSDTTKSSDNNSPLPQDRAPTTTGGGAIKSPENNSPLPQNRAPATTGGTAGRTAPVAPAVDRSLVLGSASGGLLPARNVAVVSTGGSGGKQTQVRSNEKGQFSLGPLAPGVHDVAFGVGGARQGTGAKKSLPKVTVSLLVPAMPGGAPRLNFIAHTYSRIDSNKDIRAKITVPKDGSGAIVDWGDGTRPVNVVRDGQPIDVGKGQGAIDTIGKISFVPKFQKMQMQFSEPDPCVPWWQCMPPPDPDPPNNDDPWTEVVPDPETDPPIDTIIEIVEGGPDPYDPPPNPPKIDEKGIFEIGPLPVQGVLQVNLTLPQTERLITDPPKPPVKVALLLPSEPRAAVQAMNAGGSPRRVKASDRLLLVEHVYAPDTTGQSLRVTITMAKDGESALVDWGDGTPVTNVRRDGKPIAAASVDHEAIGRILFVGAKKKQP